MPAGCSPYAQEDAAEDDPFLSNLKLPAKQNFPKLSQLVTFLAMAMAVKR